VLAAAVASLSQNHQRALNVFEEEREENLLQNSILNFSIR